MQSILRPLTTLACVAAFSAPLGVSAAADLLDSLRVNAANALDYRHDAQNAYTLLRATGAEPLLVDDSLAAPELRARNFLTQFGSVLGVSDAVAEFALQRISVDRAGNEHVHLDQRHGGLPVFGARLVVHMNDAGIRGVSGVFIDDLAGLNLHPHRRPRGRSSRRCARFKRATRTRISASRRANWWSTARACCGAFRAAATWRVRSPWSARPVMCANSCSSMPARVA